MKSILFVLLIAIVIVVVLPPALVGKTLFIWDHLLGNFGLQEPGQYHCKLNRFGAETNLSKLVHSSSHHLQPPTIEWKDYTPEKMKSLSQNYRLPVVVKGMFSDSKAGKLWNIDYFAENFGNQNIIFMELEYPIDSISSSYQRQKLPTTMEVFCKNISKGGQIVIGNDHYLMVDHPKLIEELELNRWGTFDSMPILPLSLRFFMGGKNTGVGWHAATSHNLFVEVKGKKLFKWFPPQLVDLSHLHPTLSNKLPAIEHCEGHYYDPTLPTYEYVLDDGDAAFTPAWVWHSTKHLENTIAVGVRMESFLHDIRSAPLQTFLGEFSADLPGLPFFNGLSRLLLQAFGLRIQGQALSQHEKENGYKWDWLRDYMQAGGKLKSEDLKDNQWRL